jgi:integrase
MPNVVTLDTSVTVPPSSYLSLSSLSYPQQHNLSYYKNLLRISSLAPSTMSAYSTAVSRYYEYCRSLPSHTHHRPPHPSAAYDLDKCVENYISWLYAQHVGTNRQLAVNTVYGLYALYPEFRGTFKRSEQLLRGWSRLAPSISHPPLTWPITVLIAIVLAKNGQVDAAIATLVAFDGLLRISEVINLRVADVSLPTDHRRGVPSSVSTSFSQSTSSSSSRVCLRLATTKTGKNQWSELYTDEVGQLLSMLIQNRSPSGYVFAFPFNHRANYYRHVFKVVCMSLGLADLNFTPHSLRHGGATHAHMHLNQSIEHIIHRGRWLSNNTCRSYIQSGNAALLMQYLPSHVSTMATELLKEWYIIMRHLCFSANL